MVHHHRILAISFAVAGLFFGSVSSIRARDTKRETDAAIATRQLTEDVVGVKTANLKDQLEKGLRVRRPQEFAYVDYIHALVQSGDLPIQLVLETFHWARRQDPYVPFPYFQRAIRLRAARIGINIQ